ncbi:MAG: SAM hydrolase/SAM-dependent halogenase family protein, partial [Treponemataceae bacterium]
KGTVFVSIVDPGVGTDRTSVVAKTKTGHYIVTPDNGTLTFIQEQFGIEEIREIEEAVNRRKNTEKSYTFHGRDVYAFTGARLASGTISFEKVGPRLDRAAISLPYTKANQVDTNTFEGTITMIDEPYGNVWTNINLDLFAASDIAIGDLLNIKIWDNNTLVYNKQVPYIETFGGVAEGDPLVYINSVYGVSVALNMADFARSNNVTYGLKIEVSK